MVGAVVALNGGTPCFLIQGGVGNDWNTRGTALQVKSGGRRDSAGFTPGPCVWTSALAARCCCFAGLMPIAVVSGISAGRGVRLLGVPEIEKQCLSIWMPM